MAAIDDPSSKLCWLLELEALSLAALSDGSAAEGAFSDAAFSETLFDEGGAIDNGTLYYSSHGYISKTGDRVPYQWYDGRVLPDPQVERRVFGGSAIGGLVRTIARVDLVNADAGLDTLQASYAMDGRPARLLVGLETDTRANFTAVFAGVVDTVDRSDLTKITLALSDGISRLDVPVSSNTYAGSGGLEGGADLIGKPKPKCWGNAKNVSAPLVVAASLVYQVHDGSVSDITAAYDRGIALARGADYVSSADMLATAPAAGNYRAWPGGGCYRLGSTPAGTCTADVLGDNAGGYVNKTGDIVQRLLLVAGIDASLVDAPSFAQLNIDAAAEVGDWVGPNDARTVANQVDRFLAGVGAYGGFSRLAMFTVGVIKTATAPERVASFTETEILQLAREPLPAAVEPVAWRVRVAWGVNHTVQSDLAAGVTAAQRSFAAQGARISVQQDNAVRSRRLLSMEYGPTGNLYAQQADADTESLRLINLWKNPRGLYKTRLPASALPLDLGAVVNVKTSRYGFAAGIDTRVLGHAVRGRFVELEVLA